MKQEKTMRHADRPSGPGAPLKERRDAVTAAEEAEEPEADDGSTRPRADDPTRTARHAERNAHVGSNAGDGAGDNAAGGS